MDPREESTGVLEVSSRSRPLGVVDAKAENAEEDVMPEVGAGDELVRLPFGSGSELRHRQNSFIFPNCFNCLFVSSAGKSSSGSPSPMGEH